MFYIGGSPWYPSSLLEVKLIDMMDIEVPEKRYNHIVAHFSGPKELKTIDWREIAEEIYGPLSLMVLNVIHSMSSDHYRSFFMNGNTTTWKVRLPPGSVVHYVDIHRRTCSNDNDCVDIYARNRDFSVVLKDKN